MKREGEESQEMANSNVTCTGLLTGEFMNGYRWERMLL